MTGTRGHEPTRRRASDGRARAIACVVFGAAVLAVGLLAVGPVAAEAGPGQASDPLDGENGTTEVVVRFDPVDEDALGDAAGPPAVGTDADATVADLREHTSAERTAFDSFAASRPGVSVERAFWLASALLVSVGGDDATAADLRAVENVTRVHSNVAVEPVVASDAAGGPASANSAADGSTPSIRPQAEADPAGRHADGLELIGVPTAWERFDTRGAGATVAVVDTGVDPTHQDIALAGWASFDENGTLVGDDPANASDPTGHGTHVAGVVAGGNASGTHVGVAPGAELYGVNAFGDDGTATFASVVAAMEHATVAADADVLQLSLGANGTYPGFISPVRNARATGTVVVAAVGNEGVNASSSPANAYDAVAVGAVDGDRRVPAFSGGQTVDADAAFGVRPDDWPARYVVPDVTAPGVGIVSAEAGTTDGYVRRQGTSMAAPHVSGVAALAVAATDGRVAVPALEAAVVDAAVHPAAATAPDDRYGRGVVDAPAAVGASVAASPATPADAPDDGGANHSDGDDADGSEGDDADESDGDDADGSEGDDADDGDEEPGGTNTSGRAPGLGVGTALGALAVVLAVVRARSGR